MRLKSGFAAATAAFVAVLCLVLSTAAGGIVPRSARLPKLATPAGVDFGAQPSEPLAPVDQAFIQRQLGFSPGALASGPALADGTKRFACVNGRQTDDPNSPPCDTSPVTGNPGATYQGVTADEIRVAVVAYGNYQFECGRADLPCEGQSARAPKDVWFDLDKPQAKDLMFARGMQAYGKYFNERYQTYGRRVHLYLYFFDSNSYYSVEQSKAQAKRVIDALHPAAVVLETPEFSEHMAAEFARRGVPAFTDVWSPQQPASYYAKYPDRLWGYWPTIEQSADLFARYVCTKVAPNPVSMSGVAGDNGKPRKIGLIYGIYHDSTENKAVADEVQRRAKACGAEIADVGSFVNGNGCHTEDLRHTPVADLQTLARFKLEGITTVLWPTCASRSVAAAAITLDYRPEWVVLGDNFFDANAVVSDTELGSVFNRHAVMVTPGTFQPPLHKKRCWEAMRSVDPGIGDYDAYWVCRNYGNFLQLFTGIQLAGPNLGPTSLGRGLHSLPEVSSVDPLTPACSYKAGDSTCVKDAMVMWWDDTKPTAYNFSTLDTGCWRVMEGGKRYLPDAWSADNINTPISGGDPCNSRDVGVCRCMVLPDLWHVTAGIPGLPETLPLGAERAGERSPKLEVRLGEPASGNYPGIPLEAPGSPVSDLATEYAPSDCLDLQRAWCSLVALHLAMPAPTPATDVLLDTSLVWDTSRGSRLQYVIWDLRTAPDGTKYYGVNLKGDTGKSPTRLQIVNPERTDYLISVKNTGGVNRGYTFSATLSSQALVVPADHSGEQKLAAAPTPATNAPSSPALSQDTSFPLRDSLAVRSSRPAVVGAGASNARDIWPLLLFVVLVVGATGTVLRLGRLRDIRLVWKLLLPFLVIILVGGVTATFLTTRYLTSRASTQLDQSLLQRSLGAASYLRDQEAVLVEAQRLAANTQGVAPAIAAGNPVAAAKAMASPLAVNKELDLLAALRPDAMGLVEFTKRDGQFIQSEQSSFAAARTVTRAIDGSDPDAVGAPEIARIEGVPMLLSAGPVTDDGVVGAVVAGIRLETVARSMATRVDGAVAIYDAAGHRVATSADKYFRTNLPSDAADRETPTRLRERVGGRSQATIYTAVTEAGTFVGTIAVGLPTAPAYAAVSGARLQLLLISLLVMAAVVGLGLFVSRSVLRRVDRLVETNRALGAGDLAVRAPDLGRDELGELGAGFNVMAEQLQASYAEVERRVDERTEELQRLYQDVVKGNEARSDLFASISHEFRTPIFAILAHAELMADPQLRPTGKAWVNEFGETITEAATSLLHRVDDILELAKLESTEFEMHIQPFDMAALVDRLEPQVAALARQAGLTFAAEVPAGLPAVLGDEQRVAQILLNLLSNAVRYNSEGGSITLTAAVEKTGVVINVADTGVGIASGEAKRIFEPFYRANGSAAKRSASGLGLALAKRLTEAQDGTISFTSKVGVGTTFRVALPVAP